MAIPDALAEKLQVKIQVIRVSDGCARVVSSGI